MRAAPLSRELNERILDLVNCCGMAERSPPRSSLRACGSAVVALHEPAPRCPARVVPVNRRAVICAGVLNSINQRVLKVLTDVMAWCCVIFLSTLIIMVPIVATHHQSDKWVWTRPVPRHALSASALLREASPSRPDGAHRRFSRRPPTPHAPRG